MAWIYLAESGGSLWPYRPGLGQSPTVKTIDTLTLYSCRGCGTVSFPTHLFGTKSPRLYQSCCPERELTLSTVDSPARTSALQEMEQAWKESEADLSGKCTDSLGTWNPYSYSWKTSQQSEREGLQRSSENWPAWGMTVDGQLYQPQKLEPRTCARGGSYLPTPTVFGNHQNKLKGKSHLIGLSTAVKMWPTPRARDWKGKGKDCLDLKVGGQLNPPWVEWLMGFPIGWTELSAWATQWFQSKREKRSKDY
jgi:hypothetical protein